MSTFTGIQTGPRQLELPPNMSVFGFSGQILDDAARTPLLKHVRMIFVVL